MKPCQPLLLGLLALGACTDGPAAPLRARPAAVVAAAGEDQAAVAGSAVATPPAVVVWDAAGEPLENVTVSFTVTAGGGSVAQAQARTGADGIATSGRWTLGAEGPNQVEARVGTLAPVRFTATALASAEPPGGPGTPGTPPSPVGTGSYDIVVRYAEPVSARQAQAVQSAVARWRSVILGDVPDVRMDVSAGSCFPGQPRLNEMVDDLLLYVEFVAIDGPSGTLGESGPCYIRSESGLPVIGYLKLDTADLQRMEQGGTLADVVLHELGHVLGIGTLWADDGLLKSAGTADPRFTGVGGVAAYQGLGGTAPDVPVENTGGNGTRDSHWRESEFGNELMTGFISGYPNPLSALTVGSLQDLGYGASQAGAESYVLGGTPAHTASAPVDLRGREHLRKPKYRVDRSGREHALPPQATSHPGVTGSHPGSAGG